MLKYRERNENIDIETSTPNRKTQTGLNVAPFLFTITFLHPSGSFLWPSSSQRISYNYRDLLRRFRYSRVEIQFLNPPFTHFILSYALLSEQKIPKNSIYKATAYKESYAGKNFHSRDAIWYWWFTSIDILIIFVTRIEIGMEIILHK